MKGRSVKGHGSKVGRVEGQWSRTGERSWCHRSWCPTSSVKNAGAKGHQAKGHGVTGQNLEMKGQEFKGEISVMKTRGSVQNNKHGSKLTGKDERLRSRRSFRSKIMVSKVVVSKVTGRRSVG